MKTKVLSIISAMAMTLLFQGCHEPEVLVSTGDPKGLLALTAKIPGDDSSDNNFHSEIDYDNHSIVVVFPKNYPLASDDLLPEETLRNIRITAALSNNTVIEPAFSTVDLTKTSYITVKNPQGVRTQYSLRGEIRDYWECDLHEITLADGTEGIVDEINHTILIVSTESDLEPMTASFSVSPHAKVVPDIANEPFDFDAEGAKIKVVAQDGKNFTEYSLNKGIPSKLPYGIDRNAAKLMWVKKLSEYGLKTIPGADASGVHNGIAVTDKYIVVNEMGTMSAMVLNAKTGEDTGMRLDMSIIPNGRNTYMTSDDAGHIIVSGRYLAGTDIMRVWIFDDIHDKGRELFTANVYGAGTKISIVGDITKDAIMLSPYDGNAIVYQWIITNGEINSSMSTGKLRQKNLVGTTSSGQWGIAATPTSATNPDADFFAIYTVKTNNNYGPVLFDGANNTAKAQGYPNTIKSDAEDAGNWSMNACDYAEFNNSKYFAYNSVHAQTFGSQNDLVFLMDVTGGDLKTHAVYFGGVGEYINDGCKNDGDPLPYLDINSKYGAQAAGFVGRGGNSNDMRLWLDKNGFYMYLYFMFENGSIGCVRIDCISR